MKGYIITYNFKRNGITYEIGKTYEIDNIERYHYGFHYYLNIKSLLNYHNIVFIDLKILEIEDLGTIKLKADDQICTNKIKIIREVPIEEHKLFIVEKTNNIIYYKNCDGNIIRWEKYDKHGNIIHQKSISSGFEIWQKYDKNNHLIYYKNSDNYKKRWEYDENNRLIRDTDNEKKEGRYDYSENGRFVHYKTSNNYEEWKDYDEKGNLIHYKNSNGYEYWKKYDENDNEIYYENNNGVKYNITIK